MQASVMGVLLVDPWKQVCSTSKRHVVREAEDVIFEIARRRARSR